MQFFSPNKCLQEFFFQNHPLPPSRVKWSAPKHKKRCQKVSAKLLFGRGRPAKQAKRLRFSSAALSSDVGVTIEIKFIDVIKAFINNGN